MKQCYNFTELIVDYFVYILSGKDSKPGYIGMTNDLIRDVYENTSESERKSGVRKKKLLHYEIFNDPVAAAERKRQLEYALLKKTN